MDQSLRASAEMIRSSLPCSIELPAGTGKTHLVAALAALATEQGERTLILTHTNAGVDALRRRLRCFGVHGSSVRIDTIASFSFGLTEKYPVLSGVSVGLLPDWSRSKEYYGGAARAVRTRAMRRVLEASYDFVIVDEYQDCVIEQHDLVLAIQESLPVCALGDPLQNIFNFRGNVTVRWAIDVVPAWPAVTLPVFPWRWYGHNEQLGKWLLDIRQNLYDGAPIDLRNAPVVWRSSGHHRAAINACFAQPREAGRVVAIGQFSFDCAHTASFLNGSYGMMEELEGNFMLDLARIVDAGQSKQIALATLKFAKGCATHVAAKLDAAVMKKITAGKPVTHLKRPGAEPQLALLTGLLTDASPARVREALIAIAQLDNVRMYRYEAWRDMLQALKLAELDSELTVHDAVVRVRYHARYLGRPTGNRIISRPLLIKGLEYDHAIVLNADAHTPRSLYVSLTRGRSSLNNR